MKKLLLLLLTLCAYSMAQPAFVGFDRNSAACTNNLTTCSTAGANHANGHILIAIVQNSFGPSGTTVTNTAGDTWVPMSIVGNSSHGFIMSFAVKVTAGNANDVVTAHCTSAPPRMGIIVLDYSGQGANFPIDVHTGNMDGTTTTVTTAAFSTTTTGQAIIMAAMTAGTTADTWTAGTGYTKITDSIDTVYSVQQKSVTTLQSNVTASMSDANGTFNDTSRWIIVTISSTDVAHPTWSITKTHTGSFQAGSVNNTYTITVTNNGTGPTDGSAVTVTETAPSGMGIMSMSGSQWLCDDSVAYTCRILSSGSYKLAAGSSYPPITVTVWVESNATSPLVNQANVTGGFIFTPVTTASDSTTITAASSTISVAASPSPIWSCTGLNCSSSARLGGHGTFPLQTLVTGTGTITIGSCTPGTNSLCPQIAHLNGGGMIDSVHICNPGHQPCVTRTTAPASVYFVVDSYDAQMTTPGTFSGSIPLTGSGGGSGTVSITNTIINFTAPSFTSIGTITGCTAAGMSFGATGNDLPLCNPQPGQLYDGTFLFPAPPNTYVDGNFGGVVRSLVVASPSNGNIGRRHVNSDTVQGQINADNSLVVTADESGNIWATNTTTAVDVYGPTQLNNYNNSLTWDPTNPNLLYNMVGNTIISHNVVTNVDTTIYTYPGISVGGLTNGGDGNLNKAGFWCAFTKGGDNAILFLNLNTGIAYLGNWSGTLASIVGTPRLCDLAKGVDPITHKLYGYMPGYGSGDAEIYSLQFANDNVTVTGTALVDEGPIGASEQTWSPAQQPPYNIFNGPTCSYAAATAVNAQGASTPLCANAQHEDTLEAGDGQEYLLTIMGTVLNNQGNGSWAYGGLARFNAGPLMSRVDFEAGGGFVNTFNACKGGGCDVHEACALRQPVCVMGFEAGNSGDFLITNAVNSGSNIVLTLNLNGHALNFGTGATVVVGGVLGNSINSGCAHANGTTTNVTVSGNQVTLPGKTCEGTWTNTVFNAVALATSPGPQLGHDNTPDFLDASRLLGASGLVVKRLAYSRNNNGFGDAGCCVPSGGESQYYNQLHPDISMDGKLVVFNSNNAIPNNQGVFALPTGFIPAVSINPGSTLVNGLLSDNFGIPVIPIFTDTGQLLSEANQQ